jgi:NADH-quinone oxidoreductase subunit N
MPADFIPGWHDILRFLPETFLIVWGTVLMLLAAFLPVERRALFGHLAIAGLLAAIGFSIYAFQVGGTGFGGMILIDGFATFFRVLLAGVGILAVLSSYRFLGREGAEAGEYHALMVYSIVGQMLMVTATELVLIFIGLEISSIATYVLAGYLRDDKRNNESALKYFLLGSFATAFFLYGVAMIYGATGATNLLAIRGVLAGQAPPSTMLVGAAAALMFVGLGIKSSGAPFQMWAPDVYQGAPTPVTAFMSAGPKAAAFAIFLRIFMTAFEPIGAQWEPLVWMSALFSMFIGNFAALWQNNLKRLLAYSSIAHAGYILVALTARSESGTAAVMFYLAAYAFMNVGAFAAVAHLSGKGERYLSVDDFAGLGARQPWTAAMLTIFLLSLIGVPLTAGFFGKFYVFQAALESNLVWLTILGLLNSAVAAYYYLRILVVMYMQEPGEAIERLEPPSLGMKAALLLPALGTLVLGIFPNAILGFIGDSAILLK